MRPLSKHILLVKAVISRQAPTCPRACTFPCLGQCSDGLVSQSSGSVVPGGHACWSGQGPPCPVMSNSIAGQAATQEPKSVHNAVIAKDCSHVGGKSNALWCNRVNQDASKSLKATPSHSMQLQTITHFMHGSMGCGASCNSSDILAWKHRCHS